MSAHAVVEISAAAARNGRRERRETEVRGLAADDDDQVSVLQSSKVHTRQPRRRCHSKRRHSEADAGFQEHIRVILTMMLMIIIIMITSGQSNLTTGRIAAARGRFSGIRQVTPVCTPHAHHTTCFLGTTRVHNPNGISIGSTIFLQLTASSSSSYICIKRVDKTQQNMIK